MGQWRLSLALLLLTALPLPGQVVKLPAEVLARPGRLIKLEAETDCKQLAWLNCHPETCDLIPFPDGRSAIFSAPAAGRYCVYAYGAKDSVPSAPARCTVVVTDPGPVPPPGPGPTPPVPPDPLTAALQVAFAGENDADRDKHRQALAALYRQGGEVAQRQDVTTWGALFDLMSAAADTLGVRGKLPAVQRVVASELARVLPGRRDAPLDAAGRELAGRELRRVAEALGRVR